MTTHQSTAVIEVHERNFEVEVIRRSQEVPVVVDFWAPWCGPCRQLGPVLERLAEASGGAWVLAKLNTDQNQRLAQAFRIQGIPAVKAFRDGKVVDEFTGALPESQVRAWLKKIVPSEGDALVAVAAQLEASDPQEAIARYQLALGSDPQNAAALFGLGRLLVMLGEPQGADVLHEVPANSPFFARAQAVLGLTSFFAAAADSSEASLDGRAADKNDAEAQYTLAAVRVREQRYQEALDGLLGVVQRNRAYGDDAARKAMIGLFALIGNDNPLVPTYQRKLANALF